MNATPQLKVLIAGAGIAGPTLAYWLVRQGIAVTIVERAPAIRTGGYVIDFWGLGYDIAERMGLVPELEERGYHVKHVRIVDHTGRRRGGFPVSAFDRLTNGRYVSLPRSALAAAIYARVEHDVETIFDDSVVGLAEHAGGVDVTFERTAPRTFDLVVGADGLHSSVRACAFGPEDQFERYLGYKVAAFDTLGYRPRDEDVYVMFTEVGQQVGRFAMRGDRTMFLFVLADEDPRADLHDVRAQQALLRRRFGNSGWECPAILDALDASDSLYFDRVSQIHMARWTTRRVALIGDAACCVSLLAGQGSALAMIAAYVLAGELRLARGDPAPAFARYEERLGEFIASKQRAALRFASSFAPRSAWRLYVRNQLSKLLSVPLVAKLAIGRGLVDKVDLPDYAAPVT